MSKRANSAAATRDLMRAAVYYRYGSPDNISIINIEKPTPKDGEVLIHVMAASINAYDWRLLLLNKIPDFPMGAFTFGIGALIFYYALFKYKLIPRWIPAFGIAAVLLHIISGALVLLGVQKNFDIGSLIRGSGSEKRKTYAKELKIKIQRFSHTLRPKPPILAKLDI